MPKHESLDTKDKVSIVLFAVISLFLVVLIWQGFSGGENENSQELQQVSQESEEEEGQTSIGDYFENGSGSESFVSTEEDPFIEDCLNQEADEGTTVSSNTVCLR